MRGGTRVGEFLGMAIKNVQFDKYGAIIIVYGKTGWRSARLRKMNVKKQLQFLSFFKKIYLCRWFPSFFKYGRLPFPTKFSKLFFKNFIQS